MLRKRVVILTAVALEARAIAAVWGLPTPKPGKPVRTNDFPTAIEIHLVGIRAVRLPATQSDLFTVGIIMAGLAGALDPTLKVADIVLDDCPPEFVPDVPLRRGKIHCSTQLIATPEAKHALFEKTRALAVDMESDAARAMAEKLRVPFVSVRVISDAADHAIDPAVLRLVDGFGRSRPLAIAGTLLRRPALIPQLRQLGTHANLAASHLAACVSAIARRSFSHEIS